MSIAVLLTVAGAIGLFAAFLGAKKPDRLLFWGVLFLSLLTLFAIADIAFLRFRGRGEPGYFAPQIFGDPHVWHPPMLVQLIANLGVGFRFAGAGFVLVAIFFALLINQRATLPISLPSSSVPALPDAVPDADHRRTMLFLSGR